MSDSTLSPLELMNKLRSNPSDYVDQFSKSSSDPIFQMRLMRAFAEKRTNPLNILDSTFFSDDSVLQLCVGAYKELQNMEAPLHPYPEKLDNLERISENNRISKVFDELFPLGGNCLRGSTYVDKCIESPQIYNPSITFYDPSTLLCQSEKGVFFILVSQVYLEVLWPLLFFNAAHYQLSFKVHIHIINPDKIFLNKLISRAPSNVVFTSSKVDPDRRFMNVFCHTHRHHLIPAILSIYRLPVILVGADVVFCSSADALVEASHNKIGIYRGQNPDSFMYPWVHACGDFVHFPFTSQGLEYSIAISNYINGFDTGNQHYIYLDQAALSLIFNRIFFFRKTSCFYELKREVAKTCNINSAGSLAEKFERALTWHDNFTKTTSARNYTKSLSLD